MRRVSRKNLLLLFAVACVFRAEALIIYRGGQDETTHNTTTAGMPSGLDAVWDSVVFVSPTPQTFNASAVYLGNGFFLTANHVDAVSCGQAQVSINDVLYTLDTGFGPGGVLRVDGTVDLKIFKVLAPPNLPPVTLNQGSADVRVTSYVIGCGVGKGTAVTGGWAWGTDATRAKRWGSVYTAGRDEIPAFGSYLFSYFSTAYGMNVASATLGDSGSGLFQYIGGAWVLSGITAAVTANGHSFYNNGGNPDATIYVRIADYADAILNATPTVAHGGVDLPWWWLRTYFPSEAFSDYTLLAGLTASNGVNTVAQCYVAGLDPTNAASRFQSSITFSNGAPHISWSPDLGAERFYSVLGKTNLAEIAWCATNNATRFFKATVDLK